MTGGKVTKEAYASAMKQAQSQGWLSRNRNHEAKITSVTFPSPDRAVLEFDYDMDSARGHRNYRLKWTMTKNEDRWLILETEYLKK